MPSFIDAPSVIGIQAGCNGYKRDDQAEHLAIPGFDAHNVCELPRNFTYGSKISPLLRYLTVTSG